MLPLCPELAEAANLDVGRGVAIVELVVTVEATAPCRVQAGSALRAREEGRDPPELLAFRVAIDGNDVLLAGPRAEPSVDVPAGAASVRFVAVLRGDRFAAVPLATNPAAGPHVRFRARAHSAWGHRAIAGSARFVEIGAPIVITVDPARDHEPLALDGTVSHPTTAFVVDAGPILGGDPALATEEARAGELALGGAATLSVLLDDLPLAVATAPSDALAIDRLREMALVARAATLSSDPLVSALGERTTSLVLSGLSTCKRAADADLPPRWPAPRRELVATGVLDDAETGCPRVDDLLLTNHPDVRFPREGALALADAARAHAASLPRIGPLVPRGVGAQHPRHEGLSGRTRRLILLLAAFAAFVLAFLARALPARSSTR